MHPPNILGRKKEKEKKDPILLFWGTCVFRSILSNPGCREEDVDFMLEELDRLGKHL
jgi:hypothetical protein